MEKKWYRDERLWGSEYVGEYEGELVFMYPEGLEGEVELRECENRIREVYEGYYGVGSMEGIRWLRGEGERRVWIGLLGRRSSLIEKRRWISKEQLIANGGGVVGSMMVEYLLSCAGYKSSICDMVEATGLNELKIREVIERNERNNKSLYLWNSYKDEVSLVVLPDDMLFGDRDVLDDVLRKEEERFLKDGGHVEEIEAKDEKSRELLLERGYVSMLRETYEEFKGDVEISGDIAMEKRRMRSRKNKGVCEQPEPRAVEGGDYIYLRVIDDMRSRADMGVRKYGTYLQAFNGRDGLRDAYEEVLDLAVYLRQVIDERDERMKEAGDLMKRLGV